MKKDAYWQILVFVLAGLLIWQLLDGRGKTDQITQLELDNQKLEQIVNKRGDTIQVQEAIITNSKEALDNLTDTIFDLKRNIQTIAYYKGVTKVEIRDVKVPFLDSVKMKRFSDSVEAQCAEVISYMRDSMLPIPIKGSIDSPYISLTTTVNKSGITIDSLSIPDTLQLRFVEHSGFLQRKTIEVQYFHTNPYIKSIQANSAVYEPKKNFFTRVLLPFAAGIAAGIIMSK